MTPSDWIAIVGVLATVEMVVIGAMIKHAMTDAATRVRVEDCARRLDKLDGNGSGINRVAALEREINENLRPRVHSLSNDVHVLMSRAEK